LQKLGADRVQQGKGDSQMPIRIAYEKRYHLDEADISYPFALCDLCGERIMDAALANYCWTHELEPGEEWDYDRTWDMGRDLPA